MTKAMAERMLPNDAKELDITKYSRFMMFSSGEKANDEYRNLRKSLEEHGQKEPVEVYQDGVVDGVQRVLILREMGQRVRVRFIPDDYFETEEDVERYIIQVQLSRRNVTTYSWRRWLARMYELECSAAKTRSQFVRQQARDAGLHPGHVSRALEQGLAENKSTDAVRSVVYSTCNNPEQVFIALQQVSPEEQARIVAENDTEKTILAAVKREVFARSNKSYEQDRPQAPTVTTPASKTRHVVLSICQLLSLAEEKLHVLIGWQDTPDLQKTLRNLQAARDVVTEWQSQRGNT